MKSFKKILPLLLLFWSLSGHLSAQLLRKLKDKAGAAVESTVDKGLSKKEPGQAEQANKGKSVSSSSSSPALAGPAAKAAASANDGTWEAAKYGQVAIQLREDETIMKGEFNLRVTNSGKKISLITIQDNQYYFYENNQRSGPFDEPPYQKLGVTLYPGKKSKQTNPTLYIEGTGAEKHLLINKKQYGSFSNVLAFYLSPDQQRFYAITDKKTNDRTEFALVSHKGLIKLPGYAPTLLVSDNDEYAAAAGSRSQLNAKTEEERYAYSENDEVTVFMADGTKVEGIKNWNTAKNWIGNTGALFQLNGDNKKQVWVNGKPGPGFPKVINNTQSLFLNKNATSGVYYDYGSLYFTDGTRLMYSVLSPASGSENGKDHLFWLAVNEGKLYVCKKEL